jgi:hypothetical protein
MTINRDPDRGGTSMVAVAIVAIIAIGLLYMMFAGDRTTVVRDGVSPPNVTVQTPAPSTPNVIVTPAPAPANTGAGSGTPNAPGTGQR